MEGSDIYTWGYNRFGQLEFGGHKDGNTAKPLTKTRLPWKLRQISLEWSYAICINGLTTAAFYLTIVV